MKSAMLTLAAVMLFTCVGCHHNVHQDCNCHGTSHGSYSRRPTQPARVARVTNSDMQQMQAGPSGPPSAAYGYPYYTNRAPRDFLLGNPPSIGY